MERRPYRTVVVLVLAVLLIGQTAAIATASPTVSVDAQPDMVGESTGIADSPHVAVTATRTDRDAPAIEYRVVINDVANATSLYILTRDARIEDSSGLTDQDGPNRYQWDGESSSISFTMLPTGNTSADGTLSVSRDTWDFAPVPTLHVAWRTTESSDYQRIRPFQNRDSPNVTVEAAATGVVGEKFAMLGAVRNFSSEGDYGRVHVVAPEGVLSAGKLATIHESVTVAASAFDTNAETDRTTMFVVEGTERTGGATFIANGESWVASDAKLETANNVWLHEYVHTRQSFDLGPEMIWFEEASAEYFGARLARETGLATPLEYRTYLFARERADVTLTSDVESTTDDVAYHRGARVLAALDKEIIDRSDGAGSLEDVFARMNEHDEPVTYDVFVRIVNDVSGEDMSRWLDEHVAGSTAVAPSMPYNWLERSILAAYGFISSISVLAELAVVRAVIRTWKQVN